MRILLRLKPTTVSVMMYSYSHYDAMDTSPESSRVCNTKHQLEKLVMDVISHDLNRQMQKLVSDFHKTGNEHLLEDAAYLRSEFMTWWNEEEAEFVPPAQLI